MTRQAFAQQTLIVSAIGMIFLASIAVIANRPPKVELKEPVQVRDVSRPIITSHAYEINK